MSIKERYYHFDKGLRGNQAKKKRQKLLSPAFIFFMKMNKTRERQKGGV